MNLIAYSYGLENLKNDDEVVISIMEHHSNLVPWQYVTNKTGSTLKYMYINDNFEISKEEIESANEELITTNAELRNRNDLLIEASNYAVLPLLCTTQWWCWIITFA